MRPAIQETGKKWLYVNEKNGFVAYRRVLANGTVQERIYDENNNNRLEPSNKKIKDFWKENKMTQRTQEKIDKHTEKQNKDTEKQNKDTEKQNNSKGGNS